MFSKFKTKVILNEISTLARAFRGVAFGTLLSPQLDFMRPPQPPMQARRDQRTKPESAKRAQSSLVRLSADKRVCEPVLLDITMSFGFSIGDFITVIELANKIRKDFVDAPSQFKAISDEYAILMAILTTILSTADSVDGTGSEASQLSSSMSKSSSPIANSATNKRQS
ncbi:hypothetical protein BGZ57DRAFT_858065 [Hyaloscypha finlandica]|nr:hypothetical protein BGZ57DRAFT_858065 [Hyaloscypha finlandica]